MSDTQPPEPPSILDSLTREELVEAILLREHERDAFHDANTAAVKIAAFNLRGWRTALARAERAERRMADCQRETDDALARAAQAEREAAAVAKLSVLLQEERDTARSECAALTKELDGLRADLAVMTNDRNHLMKGSQQAAPDSSPALRPFDADIVVKDCTMSMRVTAMPEEVRGKNKHDDPICEMDGLRLVSNSFPMLDNGTECIWLWGSCREDDNRVVEESFPTPTEAESYAARVRALFDAANAQWAERGGER